MKDIIFASSNKHKIKELKQILQPYKINIIGMNSALSKDINIIESGKTFYQNSLLKAKYIYDIISKPVISEDSGLEIYSIQNEPGVYSARYQEKGHTKPPKEELINRVLNRIKESKIKNKKARFVSVVTLFIEPKEIYQSIGICKGEIQEQQSGKNGFGYDSIFYIKKYKSTLADISTKKKNIISHRNQAIQKIVKYIRRIKCL